ncbi:MAG: phosphonate metabolism transcriptional regulator PhnF [Enterobacterales bacterium]|jgi:GntR family phosphonate transport system transcriptional regulator|uniref:phosphonate metabolism transcriptional regulator PhnF n=1 Tax=Hafnia TaxID=568 RepID=UPI000622352D|nr:MULTISPECIES: phosphonate metabolism transcriptional regulator PhnF [Hafnia]MDN6018583.1 phosphonate metabolism transcriptional regulator PhnF [Enterobacterales bacterium]AWV43588.1 phosphonate metabolism transcriptional regulator PhnF [Hafnia alvei]KKI43858.1 phosphonate metabolism transcriptional regulator PhnF [Hafnia alvei]MDN6072538.1 phosphonate metabolism transcriptional regulator PhnF [Enterobacterales bacterium]MDN6088560.1 phosphonate metabolism transcriptional regulator PhnF [Ent
MHLSRHPTSFPTRYQEIAALLEQDLRQHYQCGDYLPAEHQLAERYEVNRHTLRRAIDELVVRGWVQRRQGVGVLVLMRPFDYPLHSQARFSQNLLEQGSHPTSERLISVLRPTVSHIADALGMEEGQQVIHLRTLRRVNGVPVCVIDHFLPDLSWWSTLQNFTSGSLHGYIQQHLGRELSRTQTRISARRAQAKESRLLEIATHAPLMCVRTLNHCEGQSQPAEYSVSLTRADMIELTMEH